MIRKLLMLLAIVLGGGVVSVAVAQVPPIGNTQSITSAVTSYTWTLTPGQSTCAFSVSGTWSGATLTFTVSADDVNFAKAPPDSSNTLMANGLLNVTCASYRYVKVSESGITGTALVTLSATGASGASSQSSGGGGGNVVITAPTNAAGVLVSIASPNPLPVTTPAPLPSNAQGVLVSVASPNPLPVTTAAPCTGATCTVTVTPPLTGVSGAGTAQAVNQAIVADCAYNSSAPTISSGNVGPHQCTTRGELTVGTIGNTAAQGINVSQATSSNLNATVTCSAANNCPVNLANLAGASIPATTNGSLPVEPYWQPDAVGGGCNGQSNGALVSKSTTIATPTASGETEVVAGVASKVIHVCAFDLTGVLTTGGSFTFTYATNAACSSGVVNIWVISSAGVSTAGFNVTQGDGSNGLFDVPSGDYLCVLSGAFVASGTPQLSVTYAQY